MIGRTIGSYTILEKIGEGGMGTVYRGVDKLLEREVAIKGLRPELSHDDRIARRFRAEAVTLARLAHPHIATLYALLQEDGDLFMIMEFVRGRTLEEMMHERGHLPLQLALRLFVQALDGIEHAHGFGIVHRDVKPANIMVTETGQVKVMDFGIARVLGGTRFTRAGHLVGTLNYMAPEQVRGQDVDARTDIYALGVLLYELMTGRIPFDADSDYSLMQAHVEEEPVPPRTLNADIPEAVDAAIQRALAKDPGDRFQTAAAFREAIVRVLSTSQPAATRHAGATADTVEVRPDASGTVPPPEHASSLPTRTIDGGSEAQPEAGALPPTRGADPVPPPTRGADSPAPTRAAAAPSSGARADRQDLLSAPRQAMQGAMNQVRRVPSPVLAGSGVLVLLLLVVAIVLPRLGGSEGPKEEPGSEGANVVHADSAATDVQPASDTSQATSRGRGTSPMQPETSPQPADAERASGPTEADVQALLDQAYQYFAAGQLTTPPGRNALETSLRVLAARPAHDEARTLVQRIARHYEEQGDGRMQQQKYEEAVAQYTTAITVAGSYPGLLPEWTQTVTGKLHDAETRLARQQASPPEHPASPPVRAGEVRIVVRPYGDVYVDGSRKASGTNQVVAERLAEGTYRIRAVHPVLGTWEKRVSIRPGSTQEVLFNFNETFRMTVTSQPPHAEILVDGERTGRYTPGVITLHPGQRTISLRRDGYRPQARTVTIERAPEEPLHFQLKAE